MKQGLNQVQIPSEDDPDYQTFLRGIAQGRKDMRRDVLTIMEEEYMRPQVARDSVEGKAILALAKWLSENLPE